MTTVMPRAMPMMRATPTQVPSSVDERRRELALVHPPDDADQDREQKERRGHLGEPPPQRGNADAQVLPRDDAVDHDDEGQAEQDEDDLVRAGEHDVTGVGGAADTEELLVRRSHVVDERRRRIVAHPLRVAQHEPDAHDEADDQDDESQTETVGE